MRGKRKQTRQGVQSVVPVVTVDPIKCKSRVLSVRSNAPCVKHRSEIKYLPSSRTLSAVGKVVSGVGDRRMSVVPFMYRIRAASLSRVNARASCIYKWLWKWRTYFTRSVWYHDRALRARNYVGISQTVNEFSFSDVDWQHNYLFHKTSFFFICYGVDNSNYKQKLRLSSSPGEL